MTDRARMEVAGSGQGAAARDGEPPALDQAFDGDSLFALRATVAAHGSRAGLSEGRTRDLVLAVHELAANAVRHGAGRGRLRLWTAPDRIRCEVTDGGADGDPADEDSPGAEAADAALWHVEPGHGLWLVRRIADGASVQSDPSGTVAAVSFRLGPRGRPAARGRPGRPVHPGRQHRRSGDRAHFARVMTPDGEMRAAPPAPSTASSSGSSGGACWF